MGNTNTDDTEMAKQLHNLYVKGNTLVRNFIKCTVDVKCELFNTYCSSMFRCQLWSNYKQEYFKRIRVVYNRIFCMLMNIPGIVSMPHVLLQHRIVHFNIIVHTLIAGFMQRIANTKNRHLKVIYCSNYFISINMFACWSKLVF